MYLLPGMMQSTVGNISWFPKRMQLLHRLISEKKPLNIIETGFNMGHSAILICSTIIDEMSRDQDYASKEINFYIFDICEHNCVKPNFEILKNFTRGKINLHLIEGSTHDTLLPFFQENKILFDFVEIDGDHSFEGVQNDINKMVDKIQTNGIIYVDDYKSIDIPMEDLDRGVEGIDWSDYKIDHIDGVFWAVKN